MVDIVGRPSANKKYRNKKLNEKSWCLIRMHCLKNNLQGNHIYPTALKKRLDERTFQATSDFSYILHI